MIRRELVKNIENHFNKEKSALLLTGARQVGKTYAIREYAKQQKLHLVEINFFEDKNAKSIFEGAKDREDVLLRLSSYVNRPMPKGKTLVFFDEVQHFPDIITWIKFLVDEGSYRYALSGSLLGVTLRDIRSIPVGYMSVQEVFPLDLKEFAAAIGVGEQVFEHLQQAYINRTPVDAVVHENMMRVVRLYQLIGGMPAVVQTYIDTNDMRQVRQKQNEILSLYRWDIAQYDPQDKLYIDDIFEIIPSELNAKNKRFILKNMNEHRQFSRHENGFVWLRDAGVALPTYNVAEPIAPLRLNENHSLFKLFQNDVGLLAAQYDEGITMQILTGESNINYGAIYENIVAEELRTHGWRLYYFNNKKQGEVDFLLERDNEIIPIEVKSGKNYARHNALTNLLQNEEYQIPHAIVLCNDNITIKGKIHYLPLYMTMFIRKNQLAEPLIYKIDLEGLNTI